MATEMRSVLACVLLLVATPRAQNERAADPRSGPSAEASIRGRCVDGATGDPVAGCEVKFGGWYFDPEQHGATSEAWGSPVSVMTGEDGRFVLRFVPPESCRHWLELHHKGHYPRTALWGPFEPGQDDDLGDVPLRVGHIVHGRVVNTLGEVVPGASVLFDKLCLPIERDPESCPANALPDQAGDIRSARSKRDGTFVTRDPLPPGTWPIELRYRRGSLVRPREVTVPPGGLARPIEVVVEEEPSISGIVVDQNGDPAPGVSLRAIQIESGPMASGKTGDDGRFRIYRTPAVDQEAVRIEVSSARGYEHPDRPTDRIEWGATDVRIELMSSLSFELRVVEAESREPVEAYGVYCYPVEGQRNVDRGLQFSGTHEGGVMTVTGVHEGRNVLRVVPADRQLFWTDLILFEATLKRSGPGEVEVTRLLPLKLNVVDRTGAPVADHRIELVHPGTSPLGEGGRPTDYRAGAVVFFFEPGYRTAELVYAERTNDVGQCWVYGLPEFRHQVRILHGEELVHVEVDVRIDPENPVRTIRVRR